MAKLYKIFVFAWFSVFLPNFVYAQAIPTGRAISITEILDITKSLGGFLFLLGGILAGITIILSGLMYFFAASNQTRVKAAKDILKAGIIGALVIFSAGLIINTIRGFTSDPFQFFGGGGGGGGTTYDCVNGACIQSSGGYFLNDPTCQNTC